MVHCRVLKRFIEYCFHHPLPGILLTVKINQPWISFSPSKSGPKFKCKFENEHLQTGLVSTI